MTLIPHGDSLDRIFWITVSFYTNAVKADTKKYNSIYNYMWGKFEIKIQRHMKIDDMEFLNLKLACCHLVSVRCSLMGGGSSTVDAVSSLLACSWMMWKMTKWQSV